MLSKSLIQFSVGGCGCVSSLYLPMPNYGGGNEDNGDPLPKVAHTTAALCPQACSRPPLTTPPPGAPGHVHV